MIETVHTANGPRYRVTYYRAGIAAWQFFADKDAAQAFAGRVATPVLAYNADGALTPTTARAYQAATVGRDARKAAALAAGRTDRAAFTR